MAPIAKAAKSVKDVMKMDSPACLQTMAIFSFRGSNLSSGDKLSQPATNTNISSTPMPGKKQLNVLENILCNVSQDVNEKSLQDFLTKIETICSFKILEIEVLVLFEFYDEIL